MAELEEKDLPGRKPGAMEGEIWVAADFDELPGDMAAAFEALEPEP